MNTQRSLQNFVVRTAPALRMVVLGSLLAVALFGLLAGGASAHSQASAPPPAALAPINNSVAVSFTLAISPVVPGGLGDSHAAWGDYDNDGDLDLLLDGCTYGEFFACTGVHAVYRNDAGTFTLAHDLPSSANGWVVWGDYDNDGDLDILRENFDDGAFLMFAEVLRNTGVGFTQVYTLPVDPTALAWGDYDNDGRLDILIGGYPNDYSTAGRVWVYRNTGSGFTQTQTVAVDEASSSVAWGDYDNDGRLDVLLSTDGDGLLGGVYRNTGSGFTRTLALPDLKGSVAWGDYDNDGRLDFVLAGYVDLTYQTLVYHNTGTSFTSAYTLTGLADGSAAWGDFDNDGKLDLLITGQDAGDLPPGRSALFAGPTPQTLVYQNTGAGFTPVSILPGVSTSSAVVGDYDNDGRLDLVLVGCGAYGDFFGCTTPLSQIYRNTTAAANTPPTAPANLRTTVNGNTVTFQWDAASDSQMPAAELSYNVVVTPAGGLPYVLSPMAATGSGYRRLPALGNAQSGLTATLTLPNGVYRWSAQAIDAAWAGGAWAPASSFGIGSFVITPTAGAGGSITPATPQTVNYGGTQVFAIAANTGYRILDVGVDGASVGAVSVYTFTNVTANHTITAAFALKTYTVTPAAGAGGSISPNTPQAVTHGSTTSFTVTPAANYNIASVTGCGGSLSGNTYTTGAITAACTVSASFTLTTYPIATAAVPAAAGTVTCIPNPVSHGGGSNCSAAANSGYSFLAFSGACTGATCTLANITAAQAVTATFCANGSVVQNTADSGPGSLRQAVTDTCAGNVITFAPSLALQTITFASQIVLDKQLIISGSVPITLSGANATRIFTVTAGANVILDGLTLRNGFVTGDAAQGGAIYNAGALTILRSTLAGNRANGSTAGGSSSGAAIFSTGAMTVAYATFHDNTAAGGGSTSDPAGDGSGGAIYSTGPLAVTQSTFHGNAAAGGSQIGYGRGGAGNGGAIYNTGALVLTESTFSSNSATGGVGDGLASGGGNGGAIFSTGTLTVAQSTFRSNTAVGADYSGPDPAGDASGGGIYSSGALTLTQSTFTGNRAAGGANGYNQAGSASGGGIFSAGTLALSQSTFTGNTATGGAGGGGASGGGIHSAGALTLTLTTFSGNTATGGAANGVAGSASGGGIYSTGTLMLTQSIFSGNTAAGGAARQDAGNASGGGIHSAGALTLTLSTLSGNTATGGAAGDGISSIAGSATGGGIFGSGALALVQSTFSGNAATGGVAGGVGGSASGGGIHSAGALTLTQSTFSGNSATGGSASNLGGTAASASGGGVHSAGTLALTQSTFSNNTATGGSASGFSSTAGSASGGGIFGAGSAVMQVTASVLSANRNITTSVSVSFIADGNCAGAIISGGYNVSSDATCPFTGRNDFTNVSAQTLALQPNGTAPLLANSLAINNVTDPALCAGTDQLDNPRPFPCSAGALEFITVATTRYVATTGSDAGNNTCLASGAPCATLARALDQAVDGDTIRVLTGTYLVASQPISKSVLILGAGSGQTILQASATAAKHSNGRVLGVVPGRYVTLYDLTVRHGWGSGGAPNGGGVANGGALVIRNSAILSNTVEKGGGGGVYNAGQIYLLNSTLAGNRAFTENAPAGAAAATGLQLSLAGLLGMAGLFGLVRPVGDGKRRAWLRRSPPLLVVAMMLSSCFGSCTLLAAGQGGALFNDNGATAVLRFTTLAYNTASIRGGAIFNAPTPLGLDFIQPGAVQLGASVLSQNTSADGVECYGKPVTSLGQNVAANANCALGGPGDVNTEGDQVAPVQASGIAPLLASSLAINNVTNACPTADQVNQPRPATCDAGAAEFAGDPQARVQPTLRGSPERPHVGQTVVYTVTVLSNGAVDAATVNVNLAIPAGLTLQSMTQAGGPACAVNNNTAACAALTRGSQVTFVARAAVATADENRDLTATATAQAANSAQASATFLVITRAVPPPSVGCGDDYATIQAAVNAASAGSVIELCPGTYKENVTISKNLTIRGRAGAATTIVDGNQAGRVFDVQNSTVVTLEGLTIQSGRAEGVGGGIRNNGTLTVNNSRINGNSSTKEGGGIYNGGTLTVNNSTFRNNSASDGGGIDNPYNGTLTVNNSLFSGNSATGADGGGIRNYNTLTVNNSIFSGNSADSNGGGIFNYGTLMVTNSTFYGNRGDMGGGGICNFATMTVKNSIISGNRTLLGPGAGIFGNATVSNSVLQDSQPAGNGNKVSVVDAGFVGSQQGNLHLTKSSPAVGMGTGCPATDLEGKTRSQPDGCSAGAYEFSTATAGGGLAQARLEPQAGQTVHTFTSVDGAVTLDIPAGAVTQTVELAFSLGQPTGGDGRMQGVVFTPYDAAGNPLGEGFGFQQPLLLTLEYDPDLVTHGLEVDLIPMRFDRYTGAWLPFTANVVVDKAAATVAFPIFQAGEYGLFSVPPGAYAIIGAGGPAGVQNVAGGSTLFYTLAAFNRTSQAQPELALRHTLPAGLTFVEWQENPGAVYADGAITWLLPGLVGGGLQYVTFTAQVSSAEQFWGQPITSTVTLTDGAGLALSSQAVVSVNGPTTPVDDSVTTRPGQAAMLWPLMNDINPDGSPLALTALGAPAHGVATIVGDTVLYTPTAGFEGNDSFAYTVQDGQFSAQGQIQVRVARLAFLGVLKTVAYNGQTSSFLQDAPQGSQVIYTLDLFNGAGGEVAQNVVLADTLPAGVEFTAWITQAGATFFDGAITWSAASVPTDTLTVISFRARVTAAVSATVENRVEVVASNADRVAASATFVVAAPAPPGALYLPLILRSATATADGAAAEQVTPSVSPEAIAPDTPSATPAAPESAPPDAPTATPVAPEPAPPDVPTATPVAPEPAPPDAPTAPPPSAAEAAAQAIFLPVVQQ